MYLIDHVSSRCDNRESYGVCFSPFRPRNRSRNLSRFVTLSGILFAVIRARTERQAVKSSDRAETINNALNLSESMTGGKPACLKSVHQRAQAAIHACVMAMFSDWLRLNSRIVKNAYARLKEMTRQCTVNS